MTFDAVVIGAGIQGATLAHELKARGLSVLVLERESSGGGTSKASLGIIHGGLRYLQTLDLPRWRRSRLEQHWMLRHFPDLVRPLPCYMPLYRGSLRSPALFGAALAADAALCALTGTPRLPGKGRVLRPADSPFPIGTDDVAGVAVWHDAVLTDPAALLRRLLAGTAMLEGAEPIELLARNGRATAIVIRRDGTKKIVHTQRLFIAAGGAGPALAARLDHAPPQASARTLAFNLLIDAPPPFDGALAVSTERTRGRSLFLRPHRGRTLVGTGYLPWDEAAIRVPEATIAAFRSDLDRALPQAGLGSAPVAEVWAGLLPDTDGTGHALATRDLLHDHGAAGGTAGLYTLLGTKLTTARALSARAVQAALRTGGHSAGNRTAVDLPHAA